MLRHSSFSTTPACGPAIVPCLLLAQIESCPRRGPPQSNMTHIAPEVGRGAPLRYDIRGPSEHSREVRNVCDSCQKVTPIHGAGIRADDRGGGLCQAWAG